MSELSALIAGFGPSVTEAACVIKGGRDEGRDRRARADDGRQQRKGEAEDGELYKGLHGWRRCV